MISYKRLLALSLVMMLLTSIAPAVCLAGEQPPVPLKTAIQTVKNIFPIPQAFTQFSSRYNDSDGRKTWVLSWKAAGDAPGWFNAEVDAVSGEITSISLDQPIIYPAPAIRIPTVTLDEAVKTASSWLKRLAPSHLKELRINPPEKTWQNIDLYSSSYQIAWQRLANGIPVRGDGASINIDSTKGNIISYTLNWTPAQFPSSAKIVNAAKANSAFTRANMLELQYLVPQDRVFMDKGKTTVKPILVYSLIHKSGGIIDARTGLPLELPKDQYLQNASLALGRGGMSGMAFDEKSKLPAPSELSPQEMAEVVANEKLLTQGQAIAVLHKWVYRSNNMTVESANLDTDYINPTTRVWRLSLASKSNADNIKQQMFAGVNATNGELLDFSFELPQDSNKPVKLSREEAMNLAKTFIDTVNPDKFMLTRIEQSNNEKQATSLLNFAFTRLVNKIPVPNDGITISVDARSGEITSYRLTWRDIAFPAPISIMGEAQAIQAYLNSMPLELSYCRIGSESGSSSMKLLYVPTLKMVTESIGSNTSMIDAITGQPVDWDGKPLESKDRRAAFLDIKGSFAEKDIALLGQVGFFKEFGPKFLPNQSITLVSLLRALLTAKDGNFSYNNSDNAEIMRLATERGWVKGKVDPNMTVSREMLGRLLVRYLGIEYLANMGGIFKPSYKDIAPNSSFAGHAALLKGLGLVHTPGTNYQPQAKVTRAETAWTIMRLLKINLQ
ncbi:MAG: YcdB/YcdC domain-containing protein [Candidatus Saccharibacteria bacterium]